MKETIGKRIGFAVTGSFCTFSAAFAEAERLVAAGYSLTPIFSEHAASIDTRFGKAVEQRKKLEQICGKPALLTISDVEPLGPKDRLDAEPVAAPVNPTVYIGVKGDADLNGIVDVQDAVAILTYYAKTAAAQENVAFNEDENLNKLAYFLADVDTESKAGMNSGSELMTTQDAANVLTFYAKKAANQEPTWPDVIPSLKSLEGSIWYEG